MSSARSNPKNIAANKSLINRLIFFVSIWQTICLIQCSHEQDSFSDPSDDQAPEYLSYTGAPCAHRSECSSAICLTEHELGYPQGYCTSFDCQTHSCEPGCSCVALDYGTSMCMPNCQNHQDCRPEYDCLSLDRAQVCALDQDHYPRSSLSPGASCIEGCQPGSRVAIACGFEPTLVVRGATRQWAIPFELNPDSTGFALTVWPEQVGHQVNLLLLDSDSAATLELKGRHSALNLTSFFDNQIATVVFPYSPHLDDLTRARQGTLHLQSTARSLCAARSDGPFGDTLNIRIILVGAAGLLAEETLEHPDFIRLYLEFQRILGLAGIDSRITRVVNLPQDLTERHRIIRSRSQIGELLSIAWPPDESDQAAQMTLDVYLVDDINLSDQPQIIGRAGLIPGPPGVYGTPASGVVAEMTAFTQNPEHVALILAHECGHFLGLRHTSETTTSQLPYGRTDPLEDTPECEDVLTLGSRCPDYDNLMFPLAPPDRPPERLTITPDQSWVLRHNPLVR